MYNVEILGNIFQFRKRFLNAKEIANAFRQGQKWMQNSQQNWERRGYRFAPEADIEGKAEANARYFTRPQADKLITAFVHGAKNVDKLHLDS